MSLSCSCDYDYYFEPGDKRFDSFSLDKIDFKPFVGLRRKRCCSCSELIEHRALCLEHTMCRYPYSDVEAKFNGYYDLEDALNDQPVIRCASDYQCERCGEIWLNLQSLGYECLSPSENMETALKEYHEISGFNPGDHME